MHGTFYVNSGLVSSTTSDWHMTWSQLHDLAADGNEIAGHSLTHAHLTQLSASDLQHEVCDDRTNLLNQGFSPVNDFAYPYAEYNDAVKSMVQQCGYSSARSVGGISATSCSNCASPRPSHHSIGGCFAPCPRSTQHQLATNAVRPFRERVGWR